MRNVMAWVICALVAVALNASPVFACECEQGKSADTLNDPQELKTEKSAATCSCSSAGDCTCKKGACKCSKCGGHQHKVMEPLHQEKTGSVELPEGVPLDASAGFFI